MNRPRSSRPLSAMIVSLGVLVCACDATTPEEPREEARPGSVQQATYGGDLLKKVGTPVATGSTVGKTNELLQNCDGSSNSAPDVSYTWTPPYTDSFTITTAGSSFDTLLTVRTYQGSVLVGCNDNASSSTSQSSLTLSLDANTAYIITVDGAGSSAGNYQLNIDSLSCPGACQSLNNGCITYNCDTTTHACRPMTLMGPGITCDDGQACTTNDVCDGMGGCSGTAVTCNSPPGQCYASTGTCNASTGACSYTPKTSGTACNDSNACTTGDVCNGAGSCGGSAVTCNSPPGQCYASTGTCNASTGGCDYAPKTSGTACNDGNACTTGEVCNGAGSCGSGTAKACNSPPGQCYASTGTCNMSTGACSYAPKSSGTSCSDGLSCTSSDKCDGAGNCNSGYVNCASRACSMGVCGATGACEYEFMCMEGEVCSGGRCIEL